MVSRLTVMSLLKCMSGKSERATGKMGGDGEGSLEAKKCNSDQKCQTGKEVAVLTIKALGTNTMMAYNALKIAE